jgi:putative tricarboxylic transport membrane protein
LWRSPSLPRLVGRSVFLVKNAALQQQALALGAPITYLDPEEARLIEAREGYGLARAWEAWKKKADVEIGSGGTRSHTKEERTMSSRHSRGSVCTVVLSFLALFALGSSSAHAQAYPSKTIEWISHTSAGSGTDLWNRNVSLLLEKEKILNVPFIHSNRVGGNGIIAYQYLKTKKGDPHVIIAMAVSTILTMSILPDTGLGLDSVTPLIRMAQDPQVVAVRTESKFKTYKELVTAARDGSVVAGITGPTGSGRIALYRIERDTGAKFKYVTFKGGGDAVLATLGGHVEVTTENLSEMLPLVEGGKMRLLAVTGERRFKQAPDVPTLKELGYNTVVATGRGFGMPPGVPRDAAATMERALKRVYDSQAYKDYADRNMFEDAYLNSADFAKALVVQRAEQLEFLKGVGIVK